MELRSEISKLNAELAELEGEKGKTTAEVRMMVGREGRVWGGRVNREPQLPKKEKGV